MTPQLSVLVKRGERSAPVRVPVADIQGLHWAVWEGGRGFFLDHPAIAGYITCDLIPEWLRPDFGHSCTHGDAPHRVKVLIVKRRRDAAAYAYVRDLANIRLDVRSSGA